MFLNKSQSMLSELYARENWLILNRDSKVRLTIFGYIRSPELDWSSEATLKLLTQLHQ